MVNAYGIGEPSTLLNLWIRLKACDIITMDGVLGLSCPPTEQHPEGERQPNSIILSLSWAGKSGSS